MKSRIGLILAFLLLAGNLSAQTKVYLTPLYAKSDSEMVVITDNSTDADENYMETIIGKKFRGLMEAMLERGYSVSDFSNSISDAVVAAAADTGSFVVVAKDQTLSAALTIPAHVKLVVSPGVQITQGAYALSINGDIVADDGQQVFIGTGRVTFRKGQTVASAWFDSLHKAIEAVGANGGTLLITQDETFTKACSLYSDITFDGRQGYTVSRGAITGAIFSEPDVLGTTLRNITFRDFRYDNKDTLTAFINFNDGGETSFKNIRILRSKFLNMGGGNDGVAIGFTGGTIDTFVVEDSQFFGSYADSLNTATQNGVASTFKFNRGTYIRFKHNFFHNFNFNNAISTGLLRDVRYESNSWDSTDVSVLLFRAYSGGTIQDYYVTGNTFKNSAYSAKGLVTTDNASGNDGIYKNINVTNNKAYGPWKGLVSFEGAHNIDGFDISHNQIEGHRGAAIDTSAYGISFRPILTDSTYIDGVIISHNTMKNIGSNPIRFAGRGDILYNRITSFAQDTIGHDSFNVNPDTSDAAGILFILATKSTRVIGNWIDGRSPSVPTWSAGIHTGNGVATDSIEISGNTITGVDYGIVLRQGNSSDSSLTRKNTRVFNNTIAAGTFHIDAGTDYPSLTTQTAAVDSFENNYIGKNFLSFDTKNETADFNVLRSRYSGIIVTNTGAAGTVTGTLWPAMPGDTYTFVRVASQVLRIDPQAAENLGGGAGKYLSLDSDGAFVTITCYVKGTWTIIATGGTTSYEP